MSEQSPEDTEPILPDRTSDEIDLGWGEDRESAADDDVRRLTDELPPHHVDRD